MSYKFTYCDEVERVLQAVVLDRPEKNLGKGFDGNSARKFLDDLYKKVEGAAVYKVEGKYGILVGALCVVSDSSFFLFCRSAFDEKDVFDKSSKFVLSGLWKLDILR